MCDDDAEADGVVDEEVEPHAATPRVTRAVAVARRLIGRRCLIRYLLSVAQRMRAARLAGLHLCGHPSVRDALPL
jgi:hypothetical protein